MTKRSTEEDLRDFARLQVFAGLLDDGAVRDEVRQAIAAEMPGIDADVLSRAWIAKARADLAKAQEDWPPITDHNRLEAVFAECESRGVRVLQGVDDHWNAKAELDKGEPLRGIAWFNQTDVWHAIDEGMLEVNLWHATTANAAPGDALLEQVLSCFARHGLEARFDEGRIEVSARWQKRASGDQ